MLKNENDGKPVFVTVIMRLQNNSSMGGTLCSVGMITITGGQLGTFSTSSFLQLIISLFHLTSVLPGMLRHDVILHRIPDCNAKKKTPLLSIITWKSAF